MKFNDLKKIGLLSVLLPLSGWAAEVATPITDKPELNSVGQQMKKGDARMLGVNKPVFDNVIQQGIRLPAEAVSVDENGPMEGSRAEEKKNNK